MFLSMEDGRELAVPIEWFPTLRDATDTQRSNWKFIVGGEGIHWEDLITIAPNDFEYNTLYTVTVPAGAIMHGDAPNEDFSWSFTTKIFIGIEEPAKEADKILIHPNPSNGIFHVSTLTGFEWTVSNTHDTIIASDNSQSNDFTLDLSSHPKGIYYLKISQGGLQIVKKLILH